MIPSRIAGPVNNPGGSPLWDFISSNQTAAADTQLDVAHGLGAIPGDWRVILVCTTADGNYGVGTEISMSAWAGTNADGQIVVFADATNISIVQGGTITMINRTTFNTLTLTLTSWRWRVEAKR